MHNDDVYRKFVRYYDTYVGNFCDDLPMYVSLCEGCSSVLEVGCGTGRVLAALLRAGHSVTGVDISPEMLSSAENKLKQYVDNGSLRLLNHDLRIGSLADRYSCVLVTFFTFNYLLEDAEQIAFLSNIASSMERGGVLVMDLFYPKTTTERWAYSEYQMDGKPIGLRYRKSMIGDIEERIQIFTEGGRDESITTLRKYSDKNRILSLLTNAGLTGVKFTQSYNPSTFHDLREDEETLSGFVVMAHKP